MEDQPIVLPLCEEVAGDLDGVLVVVDLPDVEAVETWKNSIKMYRQYNERNAVRSAS